MILIDKDTRVIVQGATGKMGSTHLRHMVAYGTKVVAGVTPGRGGETVESVPVYDTVEEAVAATDAKCSVVFVPPYLALDAGCEAVAAGVRLLCVITEGIPPQDTAKLAAMAKASDTILIGPNCPGVITPSQCLIGILPGNIFRPGRVGMISRSGTLTYEIALVLSEAGHGQSTCVGVGGDPIKGAGYLELLELFEKDRDTDVIVLIGEIGGTAEEEAAEFIKTNIKKPVVAYIAGQTAPPGKRMGHAGAIISGGKGTAAAKVKALQDAGVAVASVPDEVAEKVGNILAGRLQPAK